MALERGTRLGLYQIESSIGAGGMGEVYRATDTRLECTVAIKVLPAELIRDKRATPRLLPVISLALSLLLAACSGAPSQPTAERGHPVAPLVNGLPLSAVVGTGHGPVPCARQAHTGSPGATCGATPGSTLMVQPDSTATQTESNGIRVQVRLRVTDGVSELSQAVATGGATVRVCLVSTCRDRAVSSAFSEGWPSE